MMTVTQLAEAFDVRPSRIHKTIKKSGMRWRLQKFKGQYALSGEDVEQLAQILGKPTPTAFDDDSPALPLEWWGMPEHREAFAIERFRREARLLALIRRAQREGRITAA